MAFHLPLGFKFAGVSCGIKKAAGKKDVTMVVGDRPVVAAGVYTQNQVCAAPVLWCRKRTPGDQIRGVVVNSGNANACTGDQGERDTAEMARLAAAEVGCRAEDFLVMSTGIIGVPLPIEKVSQGIQAAAKQLTHSEEGYLAAVDGIMTTDNGRKFASAKYDIGGHSIRIAGMAKGAGMIGPNMATMLSIITTDARLSPHDAQHVLAQAADASFNAISVEGHTSTNDSLVLLASGAAMNKPLAGADLNAFQAALTELCVELAKKIPADGEGATHVMEIRITGAPSDRDAREIARTIADSALVKTAIHGGDPNWGRIVSAAGYSGIPLSIPHLDLKINSHLVFAAGQPTKFDAKVVSQSIKESRDVVLELCVGNGEGRSTFWASDLTVEYVRFNAEYTT